MVRILFIGFLLLGIFVARQAGSQPFTTTGKSEQHISAASHFALLLSQDQSEDDDQDDATSRFFVGPHSPEPLIVRALFKPAGPNCKPASVHLATSERWLLFCRMLC